MIIGLTGRKRSGKDTVAAQLRDQYKFVRYQIASPLKKAVCELYGWNLDVLEDGPDKEAVDERYGISPRQVMQFMGAEFNKYLTQHFPQYGETTGTKLYLKRLQQFHNANPDLNIVIPDVRMPFTAEWIQSVGGYMIRVERAKSNNEDSHDTEKYIDTMRVDDVLPNTGSLDDLVELVDAMMHVIIHNNNAVQAVFDSLKRKAATNL